MSTYLEFFEMPRIVRIKAPLNIETPKKPTRCQHVECKRKLTLTDFACKCDNYYCPTHRFSEDHACSFDFKKAGQENLEKQLVKSVAAKIDQI